MRLFVAVVYALILSLAIQSPAFSQRSGYYNQSEIVNNTSGNTADVTAGQALKVDTTSINGITPSMGNGITDTGTQRVTLSSDSTGSVAISSMPPVSVATATTSATLQNAATATGNGSNLTVTGYSTVVFEFSDTTTVTIAFEGSTDGSTWIALDASPFHATGLTNLVINSTSSTGNYIAGVTGLNYVRARISAHAGGGGTATVKAYATSATHWRPLQPVYITDALGNVAAISNNCLGTNLGYLNGTTVSSGNGIAGGGTQRVTIASDSTGQVAIAANATVDLNKIAGTGISTGNGVSGAGVQRVTIASDSTGQVAIAANATVDINKIAGTAVSATNPLHVAAVTPTKTTYIAWTAYFTPVATPTDVFEFKGSGTKKVRVLALYMNGVQTTGGYSTWLLVKRSTASSGSTPAAATLVPLDATSAAATAVAQHFTGTNPTTGTLVGNILNKKIYTDYAAPSTIAIVEPTETLYDWHQLGTPIVLNSASETLCVNFGGAAVPAGMSVNFGVVWTEE